MSYWKDRMALSLTKLSDKSIRQIERQLRKYYGNTTKRTIADFERVYNKLLIQQEQGKEITPADLYKLDSYWQMIGQLRQELNELGEKQVSAFSRVFELNFFDIYYAINIEGLQAFSTINSEIAQQIINSIWCADGKSFSQRIWDNTERLADTLNEELIHCVITGKKTSELKKVLQERFAVSYSRADALARTEIAHIQTEASKKRYEDYGIQQVQIWADKDERRCPECGKLHQKLYPAGAVVPIPRHPNCRCCIVPYIEV